MRTQFVLVPSVDDAFLDAVYPQPPLEDRVPGIKVRKDMQDDFGRLGLSYVELAGREDEKEGDGRGRRPQVRKLMRYRRILNWIM